MILYTLQGYDLRVFQEKILRSRRTYRDDPVIGAAQQRLYRMIGEDDGQVIWFSQDYRIFPSDAGKFLHTVDGDARDFVAIVDTFVWNHIIGNARYIPEKDHEKLKDNVIAKGEGDYLQALRAEEDEYLREHVPADLWSMVLKPEVGTCDVQILTCFPFAFSTVLAVEQVTAAISQAGRIGNSMKYR
jgi:hypothetical protein